MAETVTVDSDEEPTVESTNLDELDRLLSGYFLSSKANKTHSVWKYFDSYSNGQQEKSKCLVLLPNGEMCKQISNSAYSNNLMKHLKARHKNEHDECEAFEKKRKRLDTGGGKQTNLDIDNFFIRKQTYSANNPKQLEISKSIALAFVSNSLPRRLIEDEHFISLLASLNPQYVPPSRYLLGKLIDNLFEAMRSKIKQSMENATKVAISADIWTKRSKTAAFLGITGHWFDKIKNQKFSAVLAVHQIFGRHDAQLISRTVNEIIKEWNIASKISFVVTDNGSNMVAAFQGSLDSWVQEARNEIDEFDEIDSIGGESYFTKKSRYSADLALEESFIEPDDTVEPDDDKIEKEISEFDDQELLLDDAFGSLNRLSCFAHQVQCCVRAVDKSNYTGAVRRRAFDFVNAVKNSGVATEALINEGKKKLLSACVTRWSYTLLALQRLVELKPAIDKLPARLVIKKLSVADWDGINQYITLMKPFADATYFLEGQHHTTISEVLPQLMELQNHIREVSRLPGFKTIGIELSSQFTTRFSFILNVEDDKYQPIYMIATALDPRFALSLNSSQRRAAKNAILKLLGADLVHSSAPLTCPISEPSLPKASSSRFKFVSELIKKQKEQQERNQDDNLPSQIKETAKYFMDLPFEENEKLDPLTNFWVPHQAEYPNLYDLAVDILSIPATSAPVERVFSQASIAIGARRLRLNGENLEKEIMLKCNRIFL